MPVVDNATKKRLRRRFRKRQLDVIGFGQQADDKIEKLLIRRFERLVSVRRFVFLWISLFILLIVGGIFQIRSLSNYYQSLQPIAGGLYSEGLIGTFTNANPIYSNGAADVAISRLVFSGLFKYDSSNNLVGDLATGYKLDNTQTLYTVSLRKDVKWQDGSPFTADDVVFTYKTIQNPGAQSPLYSSWQGIDVRKVNNYSVTFKLPNGLSAFPYSLTNGIIPQHLLKKVPIEELRSSQFNSSPIGTGPFAWKFVEVTGGTTEDRQQRLSLSANNHYWAGKPKLNGFTLVTFSDDQHLLASFKQNKINAMSGLETIPDELSKDKTIQRYSTPLTTAVMAFYNTSHPGLNDAQLRKILSEAVDRNQIANLFDPPVQIMSSPFLAGHLGYNPSIVEPNYDLASANQALDSLGWSRDGTGVRLKDGKPLTFSVASQDTPSYTKVARFLQKQWAILGVKVNVNYYDSTELQTSIIASHDYDILLYGINIGVDPDEFAYWDSSQAPITSLTHLNLSEYKSTVADQAIEAGRTRSDPVTRAIKYSAFLQQWVNDMPAVALYQPNYLYITHGPVFGYQRKADNVAADRFYGVDSWMIRQQRKNNPK